MESLLEAVQFLANSANRVRVLSALVDGRATRRDLQDEVGGSRSTVARILDEAQKQGWVDSEGSRYWLTPLGETMVTDFRSYLETVEGVHHIGEMLNHFPPPLLSLDCRHLRDAVVIEPRVEDPAAPHSRAFECLQGATEYRGLSHTATPETGRVLRNQVYEGRLDYEHVVEKAFVEAWLADPERAATLADLTEGVREWIWIYDGVVPISLHIVDGKVLVWLGKTRVEVAGLLESENPEVLSWAESLYTEYRTEAEPLSELW